MARRAEARAPVVTGADLWLAEAAIRCRPRHADIARNDLSKSLYSDPRRAELPDTPIGPFGGVNPREVWPSLLLNMENFKKMANRF